MAHPPMLSHSEGILKPKPQLPSIIIFSCGFIVNETQRLLPRSTASILEIL